MAIPDYQRIMLPLLRFAGDKSEHSIREAIDRLANEFTLTDSERKELLPSGKQATFSNRVGWARTYMHKAGLLDLTRRGHFRITGRGLDVLKQNPKTINVHFLEQFEEFREFRQRKNDRDEPSGIVDELSGSKTPEELLETAYQTLRDDLSSEIRTAIMACSPEFFEKLVVDLLVKMGYGGSRREAGKAVGKAGDEGIDGIINEDRLGLDSIYIQAKRWENVIGRPEIQKFAGALQGHRARKGIFITTSSFSKDAYDYVSRIDSKIILVDGSRLAEYMIDHNVGVTPLASYEIKRVDSDYFVEE